jgi:hypothetical protein
MPYSPDQLIKMASNFEKLANRCNCENSECPHGMKACHNKAGNKKALYVGHICDDCAKYMPEEYMKKDAPEKTGRW